VVELISDEKNKILEYMKKSLDRYGPEKMNVEEVGKLADAVKDLAEAEKACWEAEYWRNVNEAMESAGYMPEGMGYQNGQGASNQGMNGRMGYNPNRDSMGRYSRGRRGYHEGMDGIRAEMKSANPEEKEKLKRELRQILDM
jgi:hypothetical protein